jgi:hypothetical protein
MASARPGSGSCRSARRSTRARRDAWDFPVGTLFFKTFFQDPGRAASSGPSETRLIRRKATTGAPNEQWEFFVWQWNADGTGASLAEIRNRIPVTVTLGGTMVDPHHPETQRLLELPHREQIPDHWLR